MESFHHLLMKTYAAMHRKVTSETAKLELTSGQPKILEYLLGNEGADQKTIAESCEVEPATAGSVLARMEKRGLIERRRNTDDRRAFSIYLSRHGKAARQFTVLRHRKTTRRELIRAHIRSRKNIMLYIFAFAETIKRRTRPAFLHTFIILRPGSLSCRKKLRHARRISWSDKPYATLLLSVRGCRYPHN